MKFVAITTNIHWLYIIVRQRFDKLSEFVLMVVVRPEIRPRSVQLDSCRINRENQLFTRGVTQVNIVTGATWLFAID